MFRSYSQLEYGFGARVASALIAFLVIAIPAYAQDFEGSGVVVGTCDDPNCGGMVVRVVPSDVRKYNERAPGPGNRRNPYLTLTPADRSALTKLAEAILHPSVDKTYEKKLSSIETVDAYDFRRPYSLNDFRHETNQYPCTASVDSLTLPEDKLEHYGLITMHCLINGRNARSLMGVALKAGKPVRIYFGRLPVQMKVKEEAPKQSS